MAQETSNPKPTETPHADWQANWRGRLNTAAHDLNARAREVIAEGSHRRLVVEREGREVVSLPLTVVAAIGGVTVLVAPAVVLFGTIAALMARVHARVERNE